MDDIFDPLQQVELAMIRAEHQKRFQVMINFIKEAVGEGVEYRNPVVRVVVSETGAYYELLDLPEEFGGAVSDEDEIEQQFVSRQQAIETLTRAVEATKRVTDENTRTFSIVVLYTRKGLVDRRNCYIYESRVNSDPVRREPLIVGKFQPNVMPLFFKIKVASDFAQEILGLPGGMVFCMTNAGDRNLMIRIPYSGDQITDLGATPQSKTIQ